MRYIAKCQQTGVFLFVSFVNSLRPCGKINHKEHEGSTKYTKGFCTTTPFLSPMTRSMIHSMTLTHSMTRLAIPLLLLLLLFIGCQQATVPTLRPVAVNEAAAYPAQEPGTKPPILTGFAPLTPQQLDEGWVQLFDGISTFGWEISEGEGTLSVMTDGANNFLVFDKTSEEDKAVIVHRFTRAWIAYGRNIGFGSGGTAWETHGSTKTHGSAIGDMNTSWVTGRKARPHTRYVQPLTESDWRPAAGASTATWTDGVLELTGGRGMLESVNEYGDFILQLEYFTETINGQGVNSGVFFRCIPGEIMNGYKAQIFNSPPDGYHDRFIGADTGGILRQQAGRNVGPKDGEWNHLTIAARGPHVASWVNGIQVTCWTDTRAEHTNPRSGKRLQPGTIQLQGYDPDARILFRNFRIAEL